MMDDIAVIGMVCRVPGADNLSSFWEMLLAGHEGLRALSSVELEKLKITTQKNYIAAGGYIEGVDLFDADFFNLTARDAAWLDPQHRLWLEACWQALEISGLALHKNRAVGVFASAGPASYLKHILVNQNESTHDQSVLLGNVPDCLATRVSYLLNLTGPSMTLQCGCSSSLVAVHQARMSLLAKQCDAALVGGICITVPQFQGYHYIEGGFASPDGHCKPFSSDAAGTVFSSGYGVVVLKRLKDALADRDLIYATIKGSATNNDGADKASYTAPSVSGQAAVIAKAMRVAGITAKDIQYVETHGTATPIGDPIELAALEKAFLASVGESTLQNKYIIGSVKANIGHLDVAAGIVSFIKTCLMLHHKSLTPQIYFNEWNKKSIHHKDLFYINEKQIPWDTFDKRRAGVSAFGFGGTNAHIILEEVPSTKILSETHPLLSKILVLSAKSKDRLLQWCQLLKEYLLKTPDISVEELCFTLQTGRSQMACRLMANIHSIADAISILNRVTIDDFAEVNDTHIGVSVLDMNLLEIQKSWLSGNNIHWLDGYDGMKIQKIILPTAPFVKKSYWVDGKTSPKKILENDIKKTLYQSVWKQKIISNTLDLESLQPIMLVHCGNDVLVEKLIKFFDTNNIIYYLFILTKDNISNVVAEWDKLQIKPLSCIISMNITDVTATTAYPINVLFAFIKQNKIIRHLKLLTTLVVGMSSITDEKTQPLLSLCIGFIRGFAQEFPNLKTQLIDLDPETTAFDLQNTLSSMRSPELSDLCVWRANHCWQQEYQLQHEATFKKSYFKKNGVYIITGGLGDVASVHVNFLAHEYDATLILTGRSTFPPLNTDDKLQQKIERLKKWKEDNINFEIIRADITDLAAMRNVCQISIEKYGKIDGIIHCAGASSEMHYKILSELDWEHCWKLFAPKLLGIQNIGAMTQEFSIDNCLMISSISSALTGVGLSAYGASHNLLDAIVRQLYPHWRIMNWDAWNFYQDKHNKELGKFGTEIDKLAITKEQGYEILQYAFSIVDWQQFFISRVDLMTRHHYWTQRGFLEKLTINDTKHPRPHLHTEYAMPMTVLQQQLATLWGNLLGIDKVGIHDSFFELGGHSLLALEFINQLNMQYQYSCSIVQLFEAPTIALLANKIEQVGSTDKKIIANANIRVSKQLAARNVKQFTRKNLHVKQQ